MNLADLIANAETPIEGARCALCGHGAELGVTGDERVCTPCALARPWLAMRTVRVGVRHAVHIGDEWVGQITQHPSRRGCLVTTQRAGDTRNSIRYSLDDALEAIADVWSAA